MAARAAKKRRTGGPSCTMKCKGVAPRKTCLRLCKQLKKAITKHARATKQYAKTKAAVTKISHTADTRLSRVR